jgi:SAM-dependent methyltransferase
VWGWRTVTRRLSELHDVVGFDISTQQVRLAREAAPRATLSVADITELDLPPASADAVVAFYVLGHVPPEEHRPLLAKAAAWLRPGGVLLVNAPVGASEGVEPDWLGVPMYFGAIGKDATITALTGAGLAVEQAHVVQEDEDGTTVQFLWVLGLKPAYDQQADALEEGSKRRGRRGRR